MQEPSAADRLPPAEPAAEVAVIIEQVSVPSLRQVALASFSAIEDHMIRLADKWREVAFDVRTPKGLAAAKEARNELREQGRYPVQRLADRLRDEANDLKKILTTEAERVIGIARPIEDSIHAQITAEEERREAEKQAAAKAEADRVAKLEANYQSLLGWIDHCRAANMTSERITAGIAALTAAEIGPDWQEYQQRAIDRKAAVLGAMEQIRIGLIEREADQERVREAERVAKEEAAKIEAQKRVLEAERARLEAERREMQAEQDRLKEIQHRIEAIRTAAGLYDPTDPSKDIEHAMLVLQNMQIGQDTFGMFAMIADAERTNALTLLSAIRDKALEIENESARSAELAERDRQFAQAEAERLQREASQAAKEAQAQDDLKLETKPAEPAPKIDITKTINVSEISRRLGFILPAAFILNTLEIPYAGKEKASILWHEARWPDIKEALIQYIRKLP